MPTGDALMSGYYLNELLLNLLAREDPHPLLFDLYASVVAVIASEHGEVLESALRAFELLLREIGLLPLLDAQTMTLLALHLKSVTLGKGGAKSLQAHRSLQGFRANNESRCQLSSTWRPYKGCTGRAFILYKLRNAAICSLDSSTRCFKTCQRTPSLQGGVVNEPVNLK